jgi:GT2 family glycosyltransferase
LVIDNTNSLYLKNKCNEFGLEYYSDQLTRGYGANNNLNFKNSAPKMHDIFIVCNPDVTIDLNQFEALLEDFNDSQSDIYGVKVYETKDLTKWSSHNRSFPGILDPIISLLFKRKLFENDVNSYAHPDWIGGAFMIFKPQSFIKLNGFDEDFFMYYEDTDICFRAKRLNMKITYNPNFHIVHEAKREGQKFFSKAFFMNLSSMLKFFLKHPTFKIISI